MQKERVEGVIPDGKFATINFVELDELMLKGGKRTLVISSRRSGLTCAMQMEMQLTKARKPWLGLEYHATKNENERVKFMEDYAYLFSKEKMKAVFIDQFSLTVSMDQMRTMMLDNSIQQIHLFTTEGAINRNGVGIRELKDNGFSIIEAPLFYRRLSGDDDEVYNNRRVNYQAVL